jgi:hypothetical protein
VEHPNNNPANNSRNITVGCRDQQLPCRHLNTGCAAIASASLGCNTPVGGKSTRFAVGFHHQNTKKKGGVGQQACVSRKLDGRRQGAYFLAAFSFFLACFSLVESFGLLLVAVLTCPLAI